MNSRAEAVGRQDSVLYSKCDPQQSVPTITVEAETSIAPAPMRGFLSPYSRPLAIDTGSGPLQYSDDSTNYPEELIIHGNHPHGCSHDAYLREQPLSRAQSRASSRASSPGRNSHTGAEDAAQRGMFAIGVETPSASPGSPRSMNFYSQNIGAENIAQLGLGTPVPTRPPSRAYSPSRCRGPRSPSRGRPPSIRPNRPRSRSPADFACNDGLKYGSAAPDPESAVPVLSATDSTPVPEIRPCAGVARYDRNVTMYVTFFLLCCFSGLTSLLEVKKLARDA